MYDVNKFKARVKALCAQNGISQKFVSESTGHGQYFLNDVWQGKRTMSDGDFALAAESLRTTPEYLRGETDDPSPADSGSEEWMDEIKISPHKLAAAKTIAAMSDEGAAIINGMSKLSVEDLLKVEKIIDMIKGE